MHTIVFEMDGQWEPSYSTENSTQYSVITYKGMNLKKNGYVYMHN